MRVECKHRNDASTCRACQDQAEEIRARQPQTSQVSDAEIEAWSDAMHRAVAGPVLEIERLRMEAVALMRRNRQPQPADELFLSSQVAKMRAERDRAVEALRGLVELAKAVKAEDDYLEKTEHHDNYTDRSRSWARQAKATRDLVDATLRTAREVLDGR